MIAIAGGSAFVVLSVIMKAIPDPPPDDDRPSAELARVRGKEAPWIMGVGIAFILIGIGQIIADFLFG